MRAALFELVFFMVILKIPVAYLCVVVYWAIRAEPRPPETAVARVSVDDAPPHEPRAWRPRRISARRPLRPRPHGSPARAARAAARARSEA